MAGSAVLTEVRAAELGDALDRRSRESVVEAESVLVAIVDVHDGAAWFEHSADDPGNKWTIHPVKRRRERDDIKRPEITRQVFGTAVNPPGVDHASLGRKPPRLLNHSGVGVESNNLLEKASKR